MIELSFTLPWPPSVNAYFSVMAKGPLAGRMLLSSEARRYRTLVADSLAAQGVRRDRLTGSIEIWILAHQPDRRAVDLDNRLKPIMDSLRSKTVKAISRGEKIERLSPGVFEDDSDVDRIVIERGPIVKGGLLEVTVKVVPRAVEGRNAQQQIAI